tara:strand:+ start:82 stop:471 length:390 start_codon:yes stop_codon:yes gene_type:complete
MQRSFTFVILQLYTIIFFTVGFLLLFFTEEVSLLTINGEDGMITSVITRFLGSAFILIGLLTFLVKKLEGKLLYYSILAFNIFGFINLYLLFLFNKAIQLPYIYFSFQVLMQVALLFAFIDQMKKTKWK